jgi:hypothetical protein
LPAKNRDRPIDDWIVLAIHPPEVAQGAQQ